MLMVRWFKKSYLCPRCAAAWTDEWSCLCNDRCPTCDLEICPESWEDESRPLAREDFEEAERVAKSTRTNRAQGPYNVTAEMARDCAEAKLEGS